MRDATRRLLEQQIEEARQRMVNAENDVAIAVNERRRIREWAQRLIADVQADLDEAFPIVT